MSCSQKTAYNFEINDLSHISQDIVKFSETNDLSHYSYDFVKYSESMTCLIVLKIL